MRFITWNSQSALLIDNQPNFAFPYELTQAFPVYSERGETGRESRVPLGDTPRISVKFTITAEAGLFNEARNSLQLLNTQPILCPLWVAKRRPLASHPVSASWYAVYVTGSPVAVYASGSVPGGLPSDAWVVPVMVGIIKGIPDIPHLTSELGSIDLQFVENSSFTLTLSAYTATNGIVVGGVTPTVFPWRPNLSTPTRGQGARVEITRESIGQGRVNADAFYAAPSYRPEERFLSLTDDSIWQFLRYHQDTAGAGKPIWLRGEIAESRLSADVLSSQTSIAVDDVTAIGANTFLMLEDGTTQALCKVTGTTLSTLTLSSTVGANFTAANTQILSLLLVRFTDATVSLRFEHDTLAQGTVKFREVPWETVSALGETVGVTHGALTQSAYLYTFTMALPGAAQTWRYTDFERDLTNSGNTYTAKHFEHGNIIERVGLDRQKITVKSRAFAGNPLLLLIPFQLEFPMMLEVTEVDVSGSAASNLRTVYYGEVSSANIRGPYLEAEAQSMPAIFERKIPRMLVQPTCNWSLFDTGCGISKASWEYLATVSTWTVSGLSLVVTGITKSAVVQTGLAAHFFAGGYIIVGSGASQQFRLIGDNAVQSGANLTLTLATALWGTISPGDPVKFYPGCDGRVDTCNTKFANKARFGGFPFAPIGNPSFLKVSKNLSTGGKK